MLTSEIWLKYLQHLTNRSIEVIVAERNNYLSLIQNWYIIDKIYDCLVKIKEVDIVQVQSEIDIIEQDIVNYSHLLLEILLIDRTTGKNIIWATDDYNLLGQEYCAQRTIESSLITGSRSRVIQPRITKEQTSQTARTRDKAEVFTPSWICNEQNNLVDEQWFRRKNVFNIPVHQTWRVSKEKIVFPDADKCTWKNYVDAKRMEISCGEAPYLVSRYDTVTGRPIKLQSRIGLLDRKLRVVNENAVDEAEWLKWTERAFQSIYAYEYQGDNLLLARENLLYTFVDNLKFMYKREPIITELKRIATVISWNIWQMDAMTYTIPYGEAKEMPGQFSLFDVGYADDQIAMKDETFSKLCRIKDWRSKEIIEYKSLVNGAR